MKILNKINVRRIVENHCASIRNINTGKPDLDDYMTFVAIPVVVASILISFGIFLKNDVINIIITTLSIFVGLMFNIIVIIFDIVKRHPDHKVKNAVLKEILANVSFAILLSLTCIVFTIITYVPNCFASRLANWISYFLITLFVITLLMILKRMYNVFEDEMNELEKNK